MTDTFRISALVAAVAIVAAANSAPAAAKDRFLTVFAAGKDIVQAPFYGRTPHYVVWSQHSPHLMLGVGY